MKHASFSEALKAEKLMVGKGGLPRRVEGLSSRAGCSSALPNHELFSFESLSVSLRPISFRLLLTWNFPYLRACWLPITGPSQENLS